MVNAARLTFGNMCHLSLQSIMEAGVTGLHTKFGNSFKEGQSSNLMHFKVNFPKILGDIVM